MSLDSWVQVGIWVSVCTVCPSLCCQSHSLCHTFVTPPAPLCSCFPSTPAGVFLLPFPCCPGSCPASLGLGSSLGMCSCCDALADGERGIPPYFGFLFLYPVGMSCSLCLCLALKMRNSQELLQERQGRTAGCHDHLPPVTQGITGFVQPHFQNFRGNSGNRIECLATVCKWMIEKDHCVVRNKFLDHLLN